MNCSGKHAAMLLACAVNDWPTNGYLDPAHPLQQHIRATMAELTGVPVAHDATDGCGAPLFSTTPRGIAQATAVSMKIVDGSPRATTLLALRVLEALGSDVSRASAR